MTNAAVALFLVLSGCEDRGSAVEPSVAGRDCEISLLGFDDALPGESVKSSKALILAVISGPESEFYLTRWRSGID